MAIDRRQSALKTGKAGDRDRQLKKLGDEAMISSILMTAAYAQTTEWSLGVAITMILCNLFAIAIGRSAIQNRGQGPALPISSSSSGLFEGFGLPELLATASFGHILGAGMILGLANAGVF